jgi:hypothetical protein
MMQFYRAGAGSRLRSATRFQLVNSPNKKLTIVWAAPAYRLPDRREKTWVHLAPNADKLGPKPSTMLQNKARRTNEIDFLQLPWAQEVWSSNLHAPTRPSMPSQHRLSLHLFIRTSWSQYELVGIRLRRKLAARSRWDSIGAEWSRNPETGFGLANCSASKPCPRT